MHKKSLAFKKWLATLAMFGLVASGAVVIAPIANASQSATPLDFISDFDIGEMNQGDFVNFLNIDADGNRAKVTVINVTNISSDEDKTMSTWDLYWSGWSAKPSQPGGQTYGLRVRYSLDGGAWVYQPALNTTALSYSTDYTQLTGLTAVLLEDRYKFEVVAYDSAAANPADANGIGRQRLSTSSSSSTLHAQYSRDTTAPVNNQLERLDSFGVIGDASKFLNTRIRGTSAGTPAFVKLKIEFFLADGVTPKTYSYLSANAYDMDNDQFVQFSNVSSYQLLENNNIESITEIDPASKSWKFQAKSTGTSGNDETTLGRVMVNFENVNQLEYTFGDSRPSVLGSGSMQLDISSGRNGVTVWTPTTPGVTPIAAVANPTAAPQVMSAIDVNPTNITVENEIITILGANLNTVTDVFIGGVRVPIFTQTGNRLQVRAPKGLSGAVDLELKSSLNDVLLTKHLNFGSVAAVGSKKRTLIVGGFAHNSRKLTPRMQNRIDRWLDKHSDLSTLTCTGFTSLPRRTTDVTLSTNRGITACNFAKRQRSELETSVSQGIEDPRPGSNVRRVRLVLTP